MTRNEKIAWFNLAVVTVATVLYVTLFAIVPVWKPEIPISQRIVFSSSAFAIVGLCGLTGVFFRKAPGDERDALIQRRATFGAHMLFWLYFVAYAMIIWGIQMYHGQETVAIDVLPLFVFSGMTVVITAWSVITLVLYRSALDAGSEV